jgi:enoyl-CoA hydratase/carnithine racemase
MWSELNAAMDDAEMDADVKVIILGGAGSCFSSGADIYERLPEIVEGGEREFARLRARRGPKLLWQISKPIITKAHGYCIGLGCQLVMYSDICIASEEAVFGEPEGMFGLFTPALLWMAGPKKGMEMVLLGETIDANEACRVGIINRVVPRDRLEEEVDTIARKLLDKPSSGMSTIKRMVHRLHQILGYELANDIILDFFAYVPALDALHGDDIGFWKTYKEKGAKEALKILKTKK